MIKGIGIDIIEISRIEEMIKKQGKFPERILTSNELDLFQTFSGKRQAEFLAGRYAAKEAFSKAYGTGIGSALSFQDMEIMADKLGKPFFSSPDMRGIHLSITHSREYAAAQVIIEE
ncbi:holo-ACP synthase [Heyndrickxia acidicola]|uniref:Holo-[acyl-carrier-protein] synthase n=1 Tax=Heyndrickxia acidicola TaxID=209389 RepID=A0ABU6ML98_9BACI|nr:holo-ACP synthase [Heyndrickxia acidicola]MED1205463.1 holo-ACP synthase [Heyndrickxia acidicola]